MMMTRAKALVRYQGFSMPVCPSEAPSPACFVYLIESAPFLKIGLARDLGRRLNAILAHNPHGASLRASRSVPYVLARQVELRLHRQFADRSVGREWFRDLDYKEVLPHLEAASQAARLASARWYADNMERRA